MIGRIRGNLVHKQPPVILVETGGVGYEIQVPMTTLFQLPELGAPVSLVTHFVVREDAQLLYGFIDERDRILFRQLIKVNGVGPKLALTILSGMDANSFVRCIQRDDMSSLVALPGVGKKTAERDIVSDAEGALIALGYKPQDATRMVAAVNEDSITDSEELIRLALKSMVRT
jgi:Holliday junction DNA helicase RuvA